ncbi:MAG: hypothetical protein HQL01_11750 [Nitrospirae bacterium]|nr:hypothetical protein [Nitrospirota bacterium]
MITETINIPEDLAALKENTIITQRYKYQSYELADSVYNIALRGVLINLSVIIVILLNTLSTARAECEHAKQLYEKAIAPGVKLDEKIAILNQSLDDCKGFAAFFELGKALVQRGDPKKEDLENGIERLKVSIAFTVDKKEQASAYHRIALIYKEYYNKSDDAIRYYKTSLRLFHNVQVEQELMELEKQGANALIPSETIASTLIISLKDKAFAVVPSIDLRVYLITTRPKS